MCGAGPGCRPAMVGERRRGCRRVSGGRVVGVASDDRGSGDAAVDHPRTQRALGLAADRPEIAVGVVVIVVARVFQRDRVAVAGGPQLLVQALHQEPAQRDRRRDRHQDEGEGEQRDEHRDQLRPQRNGSHPARRFQHVTDAAHGVDHRGAVAVDLLAQVADVELDDVRVAAEVVAPHPVEDLRLRQHPARVEHQVAQQVELGRGELHEFLAAVHLAGVLVHDQVTDRDRVTGRLVGQSGASHQATQPGEHLLHAERLGDVVVARRR